MSNKNTTQLTTQNFIKAFAGFIKTDRLLTDSTNKATFDSNANKRIALYNKVINLLNCLPADVQLETELTSNGRYNIGTLVECIVKAVADGYKVGTYNKAVHSTDIMIGNKRYEIKAGLTSYSKPTPCKADAYGKYQATILVNADGVWLINASDVATYLDSKGCLPSKGACGKHYKKFEQALGYNM